MMEEEVRDPSASRGPGRQLKAAAGTHPFPCLRDAWIRWHQRAETVRLQLAWRSGCHTDSASLHMVQRNSLRRGYRCFSQFRGLFQNHLHSSFKGCFLLFFCLKAYREKSKREAEVPFCLEPQPCDTVVWFFLTPLPKRKSWQTKENSFSTFAFCNTGKRGLVQAPAQWVVSKMHLTHDLSRTIFLI